MMEGCLKSGVFLVLISLFACQKQDFPSKIILSEPREPESSEVPCNYSDSAEISGFSGMKGKIWKIELVNHIDYEEVILRYYASSNVVAIRYNQIWGFDDIKKRRINFSKPTDVKMEVRTYDGSNLVLKATAGELYIVPQIDGNVKFDWCDITFSNASGSVIRKSKGGFLLTF